jgi:hypothetical protein
MWSPLKKFLIFIIPTLHIFHNKCEINTCSKAINNGPRLEIMLQKEQKYRKVINLFQKFLNAHFSIYIVL